MNIFFIKKQFSFFILFLVFNFCFISLHPVFFLNRYLIPYLNEEYIFSAKFCDTVSIRPFYLSSYRAHYDHCILPKNELHEVYELEGPLALAALDNALIDTGAITQPLLPAKWIMQGMQIPIGLGGRISGEGVAWNINKSLCDSFVLGCSGGIANITGALKLKVSPEYDFVNLTEGTLYQIFSTYRNLASADAMENSLYDVHTHFTNIDIYARYSWLWQFFCGCRYIGLSLQGGMILPTDGERNIDNPAGFSLGTDNRWGGYGKISLDIVLKEDMTFGMYLMGVKLQDACKIIRTETLLESQRYGTWRGRVNISSGMTWLFSPYLSIEGIRNGLGLKLSYSSAYHCNDAWSFIDPEPQFWNQSRAQKLSVWAQEHVGLSAFYDFTRLKEEYFCQPLVGIECQIPVDWFFSTQSAKCLAMSLIFELLY